MVDLAAITTALSIVLAGPAVPARMEAPTSDAASQDGAMRKFEEAERLYARGEYAGAIRLLREVLETNDDPVLYFNLGRAHEGAGESDAAISAYEHYLEGSPDAPDSDDVRSRITRLRAELEEASAPPPRPAPAPVVDPNDVAKPERRAAGRVPHYVPWIVFGVGAAGLAAGGVFGVLADRAEREAEDARAQTDAVAAHDRARRHALGANVSFAVGGALAAAGLTWGIISAVSRRRGAAAGRSSAAPIVRPIVQVGGLGLTARF